MTVLGNMGNVYHQLGDLSRAIQYYEQELSIARKLGDRRGRVLRWETWALSMPIWATIGAQSSTKSNPWQSRAKSETATPRLPASPTWVMPTVTWVMHGRPLSTTTRHWRSPAKWETDGRGVCPE